MNYQCSSFRGEENWNENLWKDQKAETSLKIWVIFLLLVNLYVVQKVEQAKLYL